MSSLVAFVFWLYETVAVSDITHGLVCVCLRLKESTILINGASLPIQFIL